MGYIHEDHYYSGAYGPGTEERSATTRTLDNKGAVCRYYQAGNCRRGSSCPFVHPPMADPVEGLPITHPNYQGEHIYAHSPPKQTPVYPPPTSQAHSHFLWQPYPPYSSSFDPRYGILRQPDSLLDYPDDRSESYSSESSSTAASLEDARNALGNLRVGSADQATMRGMASHSGDLSIIPSPGYVGYSYPVLPAVKAEYNVGRGRATSLGQYFDLRLAGSFPSPYLLPWQDDSKKKPLAYKTKPCKFYAMNGKCTSGEKCTFIHDLATDKANTRISTNEPALPSDANLPPKPLNKYEDLKAKDFYPITWRVIGGGVMMGGQRQICPAFTAGTCKYGDDCKLAHETEVESDPGGFVELRSAPVRRGERSARQPIKDNGQRSTGSSSQKRKSVKVQSTQIEVSSATHDSPRHDPPTPETPKKPEEMKTVSSKSPISPMHRRTQSMIIVTSPTPHDKVPSTYAAEL